MVQMLYSRFRSILLILREYLGWYLDSNGTPAADQTVTQAQSDTECRADSAPVSRIRGTYLHFGADVIPASIDPTGLLTLCCFVPENGSMVLAWHNDLLLSHYQDIGFPAEGVKWKGGILPDMWVDLDCVCIQLQLQPQIYLSILGDCFARGGVRVTDLTLYYVTEDLSWVELLSVEDECLAEDIYLATCKPDDWRRGEQEEDVQYGW